MTIQPRRLTRLPLSLLSLLALFFSSQAAAIQPIPEETGWSGFVLGGAGYTDVKSNTIVGNDVIDVGSDKVSSIFQSPRSDDTTHPVVAGEVRYTLANRSQFFLGASLEDQLTMDFANQFGWRKQSEGVGIYQIGLLTSLPAPEVWEDPYLAGRPRSETDRDATGVRFEWDRVMDTSFGFLLQTREFDIDKERSGSDPALGCDASCQRLLDRNGDQFVARVWYRFILSPQHILETAFRIREEDRDGGAISRDAWAAQLSYSYLNGPWTFVGNVLVGESDFDKRNPLYGRAQDADTFSASATMLYKLPTNSGRWQFTASLYTGDYDSDIRFHDTELTQFVVGMIYNFGG